MPIDPVGLNDTQAIAKVNAAIGQANLVPDKADQASLDIEVSARKAALAVEADERRRALAAMPLPVMVHTRPGEALLQFTTALTGGDPAELPEVPESRQRFDDAGQVVRLAGDALLAARTLYPLEPGRRYLVEFAVQRRVNSPDPDNDAIRCALAWYDQGRTATTRTTVSDLLGVTVGSGRRTVSAVVSRAGGADIDIIAPASARYARPYVQTYGTVVQSDVEVIRWTDITDAATYSPDLTQLEGRVSAQESVDAGSRLSELEGQVTAPNALRVKTLGDATATPVPVSADVVETLSYQQVNDLGRARYRRSPGEPTHAGKFQDDDGSWWEINEPEVSPSQVGALASPNVAPSATYPAFAAGPGDQKAAFQAWLNVPGYKKVGGGRRTFRLDGPLVIPANDPDALKLDLGSTVFDCSRFATTGISAFSASGVRGARRSLSANFAKGSEVASLPAPGVSDLLPGMMVRIGSNKLFDASSTSSRLGELNWIEAVGATSVTLRMPSRDSYLTADAAFIEPIYNPLSGFELMGGEFYGKEAAMNNAYGIVLAFMDNPKVDGARFNYFDYLAVAFQSCFHGEADICVSDTRPSNTGYGIAFFDACLGGEGRGKFRNVRHAVSMNNLIATEWGIPRDVIFRVHALYSAPSSGNVGGAALDAHTAAENISFLDCVVQGATGPALNIECPSATVRNLKAIDSQNSVSAVLINNQSDRKGRYEISGINVDGSAGRGITVQGGTAKASSTISDVVVTRAVQHAVYLENLEGVYYGGGVLEPASGQRGITVANTQGLTVAPYTCRGGDYSTYLNDTVTQANVIRGSDSSINGVRVPAGTPVTPSLPGSSLQAATVVSNSITLAGREVKAVAVSVTAAAVLSTINGAEAGQEITIRPSSNANPLTVQEGGNIQLIGNGPVVLGNSVTTLKLFYTGVQWLQTGPAVVS